MPDITKESAFESAIEEHLAESGGYVKGEPGEFDRELCLCQVDTIEFIKATQPKVWSYFEKALGTSAEATITGELVKALDSESRGSLEVIRHGFKVHGKTVHVAYFRPASGLNPDTEDQYQQNILKIIRQVRFSPKDEKSLDIVIFLNGIPIITAELKNPMSGQSWWHAVKQYKYDRDPREKIFQFKKRALVHFALDPDEVHMTTQLKMGGTKFLPFNKGSEGGKGNPPNPNGFKTAYLWEEVLVRESILDILARFVHLEVSETRIAGKKYRSERMIFPRYHQLDAVRRLIATAAEEGTGHNYLIQHSAGSGKSNTIAWLAHRLATLHGDDDEKVFDSVVVVTDRLVLDKQLQDTIYQFEHKHGVVEKIEEDSAQLAFALGRGTPIIITTLQKFPFVAKHIEDLEGKRYGVIVDEAHSSQGGQGAAEMKKILAGLELDEKVKELTDDELLSEGDQLIYREIAARGKQKNISFFAFTATPKYKTLEIFGRPGPDDKPRPFHLYSMRQAIEEGFILDVLKHYTTYKAYFGLIKAVEDDPFLDKHKAAKALARFMSLHPYNISQKTEIMIEHFRSHTRHKIGGKAKAMLVTGSRLHAVRYKQAFDKYIHEKGYSDIRTLVAFSGLVLDPDAPMVEYTEVGMNKGVKERELPERFAGSEYNVLIVAEKYQTGFDQPLLHSMYVDKRLAGIQAVQTLSRLNRTCEGKEDTFILDFVNEPDEILEAFEPYYERTEVGERVDPSHLNEIKSELDGMGVYHSAEVEEFARIFYKPSREQSSSDAAALNRCLDPAVKRFADDLEAKEQELFRSKLIAYRNLYSFVSQIIPYADSDLEKLYTFVRYLLTKLPKRLSGVPIDLSGEVDLQYYRLEKVREDVAIDIGGRGVLDGPTEVGSGVSHEDKVTLSELIDILNAQFGTEFQPADQLFFDQVKADAMSDEKLVQAATVNSLENFALVFAKVFEDIFISRLDQNEALIAKVLNNDKMRETVAERMGKQVYDEVRHGSA